MGELVLGTLHPLARLSNVSMGMVVLGHGMEMMILPWQPHVLQSVVVTLPLLRTAQPPTGMGAATVLELSSPTPALKGRQGWLCVMQHPLPGYPPPSLIVLLGARSLFQCLLLLQSQSLLLFQLQFQLQFQPLFQHLSLLQPQYLPQLTAL